MEFGVESGLEELRGEKVIAPVPDGSHARCVTIASNIFETMTEKG